MKKRDLVAFKTRTSLFLKGIDVFACTSFLLGLSLQVNYADPTDKQMCNHRALWSLCCWCFVSTGLTTVSKAGCRLQQHTAHPDVLGFRERYYGTEFSCRNCYSLFHQIA